MKITTLTKLKKKIKPYTATLFGDVFDLVNVEHVRFLRECSKVGRPLVVIVQADKTAYIRSGFNRPIINEKHRAEIIAAFEFVDFVLILEKPSDYDKYLETIKPKYYIFPKGIMKHRKNDARLIIEKYPRTKIEFLKSNTHKYNLNYIIDKIQTKRNYNKIKNLIIRRLYFVADNSDALIGKISALITLDNKIIAESDNIEGKNMHAEEIVMHKAKARGIDLKKVKLYVLIPPCILCAKEILENNISEVYYLHNYGNDDGLKLLRKKGIRVRKIKDKFL